MANLVIANWKMNGSLASFKHYLSELSTFTNNKQTQCEVVVCPPFPYISFCHALLENSKIFTGAQNCHKKNEGSVTGEVSTTMLKELGTTHVIVGHSERRSYYSETNQDVKDKATQIIEQGLIPVICIGESKDDRDSGKLESTINQQLKESLPEDLTNAVIAYEPVWCIGGDRPPEDSEILEVHEMIYNFLIANYSEHTAKETRILYGGSVSAKNTTQILAINHVSGVLVGRASMEAEEFTSIISQA